MTVTTGKTETITFKTFPLPAKGEGITQASRVISDNQGNAIHAFPREEMDHSYSPIGPIAVRANGEYQCVLTQKQYNEIVAKLKAAPTKKTAKNTTEHEVTHGLLTNLCPKKPQPELEL